jgi:hypothetical protein
MIHAASPRWQAAIPALLSSAHDDGDETMISAPPAPKSAPAKSGTDTLPGCVTLCRDGRLRLPFQWVIEQLPLDLDPDDGGEVAELLHDWRGILDRFEMGAVSEPAVPQPAIVRGEQNNEPLLDAYALGVVSREYAAQSASSFCAGFLDVAHGLVDMATLLAHAEVALLAGRL